MTDFLLWIHLHSNVNISCWFLSIENHLTKLLGLKMESYIRLSVHSDTESFDNDDSDFDCK